MAAGPVNRTPTHTACTGAHITTAQSDHLSSREHAWLKIASHGVPHIFCHPRVMSRSLPHLTLTTSTSSLSPTSPILQSSSLHTPNLLTHDPKTLRQITAERRILGIPIAHRWSGPVIFLRGKHFLSVSSFRLCYSVENPAVLSVLRQLRWRDFLSHHRQLVAPQTLRAQERPPRNRRDRSYQYREDKEA